MRQIVSTAVAALVLALPGAATGEALTPLPASDYSVSPACAPPGAGHASCLALRLTPRTAAARAHTHPIGVASVPAHESAAEPLAASGRLGLRPQDLHAAYDLPDTSQTTQTIALVDAYNDPTAATDLQSYEQEFGLSSCAEAGCFRKVDEEGLEGEANMPFPKSLHELETALTSSEKSRREEAEEAIGWGTEISLDIESARAICQNCHILLVEADSTSYADLGAAESTAQALGATEISNSWGGGEQPTSSAFNHPGTVITASTGDDGYLGWDAPHPEERGFANFPASSPDVIAVGGTRLRLGGGSSRVEETVWNGDGAGGGGCSAYFKAPLWQEQLADWSQVGCGGKRSEADVSADADPYSGIAITDSDDPGEQCEEEREGETVPDWCTYGGTSLASPLIAATFALAGGANGVSYPAQTLYESLRHAPGSLYDVTSGSNGKCTSGFNSEGLSRCTAAKEAATSCSSLLTCLAAKGYDGPSGVGTPDGIAGFVPGTTEPGVEESSGEGSATTPATSPAPPAVATVPTTTGTPTTSPAPITVPAASVLISDLALTPTALAAVRKPNPTLSRVDYAFVSNVRASLRVTLARRIRSNGHWRWVTVTRVGLFAASAGRNSRRLPGARKLPSGTYRLTLAPLAGSSRSLTFAVA